MICLTKMVPRQELKNGKSDLKNQQKVSHSPTYLYFWQTKTVERSAIFEVEAKTEANY